MPAKALASFVLVTNVESYMVVKPHLAMYFINKIDIIHIPSFQEVGSNHLISNQQRLLLLAFLFLSLANSVQFPFANDSHYHKCFSKNKLDFVFF